MTDRNDLPMEDRPVFDYVTVNRAVEGVCDLFDELGLTLFERFYAAHAVAVAASGLLGENYAELSRKLEEKPAE